MVFPYKYLNFLEYFLLSSSHQTQVVSPCERRSIQVKSELADCEELIGKMSQKDQDLVEMQMKIKGKNDDIQEAKLRAGE